MNGELPKGWVWTNLDAISNKISDGSHNPPPKLDAGIPMLSATNILNNHIRFDNIRYISEEDYKIEYSRTPIEVGDVLLSIVGTIGRSAIVKEHHPIFALQRSVALIKSWINPKYLSYFLQSPFSYNYLLKNAKGTAQKGIYLNQLKNVPISLSPLAEQQRIVNKIEELFTNLDKGIESLNEVKYKLKIYRQAILKYAMEGKLTEKWREKNKDRLEFSPEINSKIKGKIQNEELNDIRKICFIEIPNEWIWSSVGNIGEVFGGKRIPKGYIISDSKTNHPYIRVTDFSNYGVKREGLKYLDNETYNFIKRYIITKNDVYISIAGSIGKVGTIPEDLDNANLTENAARIVSSIYNNRLMAYFLNSEFCQLQISRYTIHTNQPKLALFRIKKLIIPLPSLEEQNIIVERIEQLFSLADYIEETVDSKLEQSKTLRQSILKKAFEGKLVPQDPNDEPAEILLEKIKKQRLNKEKIVQEKLI